MKNSEINLKFLTAFMLLFFSIITFADKNSTVIKTFENKFPQDKFYFIQGLDYKFDLSTNIRYRGILYSDRLEKMGYPFGLELALEGGSDGSEYLETYEGLFLKLQVDKPIEDKMKEIFGPKSVLENNFYPYIDGYRESGKNLEHEGVFLDDWEIIYSADLYQMIIDYSYDFYKKISQDISENILTKEEFIADRKISSREKLKILN